jgi:hypothetical protein
MVMLFTSPHWGEVKQGTAALSSITGIALFFPGIAAVVIAAALKG